MSATAEGRAAHRRRTATLQELIARSLAQAMAVQQMERLARRLLPGYNLHARCGFPESIPVPQLDAAVRIAEDLDREGLLPRLCEELIHLQREGSMGRKVSFRLLPRIVSELRALGWAYSEAYSIFVEDGRKTNGWGILREDAHYELSFLRLDVVRNTDLVRRYPQAQVARVYADLQALARAIVEKRDGRLWAWQGDGGVAAFYFGNRNVVATLCGIELLLELFLYNRLHCPLDGGVSVRLAVHAGQCQFQLEADRITSETLRQLERLEAEHTEADSLTLSPVVYTDLGSRLSTLFRQVRLDASRSVYRYRLCWK